MLDCWVLSFRLEGILTIVAHSERAAIREDEYARAGVYCLGCHQRTGLEETGEWARHALAMRVGCLSLFLILAAERGEECPDGKE